LMALLLTPASVLLDSLDPCKNLDHTVCENFSNMFNARVLQVQEVIVILLNL